MNRRIQFFHDRNYGGYFSAPHGFDGDATFVSDRIVDAFNGNIGKALDLYGQRCKLNRADPYHRLRVGA